MTAKKRTCTDTPIHQHGIKIQQNNFSKRKKNITKYLLHEVNGYEQLKHVISLVFAVILFPLLC